MPDPQTPAKGLTQPLVDGDNNAWGGLLNADLALIDSALGGTLPLSISGNTNLNTTQVANTGYEFTGTLSATATITWPAFSGLAAIQNATTGGHSISCGISGGAFVSIPNGSKYAVWSDGTNFVQLSGISATTGSGSVVLENAPTIGSPIFTGTVGGAGTIPNSVLVNDSITIAGHAVSLGGTQTLAASDLTNGTTGTGAIVLAASPTLTGTPTGPTASAGTNTNQIATTLFVNSNQLGISVRVLGATGNGSTDDAPAINAAIGVLVGTGGIVWFPPGIYICGSSITIPSNVILVGSGRGATILRAKASTAINIVETTNFSSLTGTNSTGGSHKFGLRSLSIDGNKGNGSTGNGLTIYGFDFNLDDIEIYNCSNICLYSEWGLSGTVPTSDGDSMEAHIHGLKTYGAGVDGIQWFGPHDSTMDDVQTFINGRYGLYVENSSTYSGGGTMFSNFHSYGNANHGVLCNANIYCDAFESESNTGGDGIHIIDTSFGFFDARGVSVYNNSGNGFNITAGYATIAGIQAFNNTGTGVLVGAASTMSDVVAYSNGGMGVHVTADSWVFSAVRVFSNTGNGMQIDAPSTTSGVYAYLNGGHGVVINSSDSTVDGINAQNNTGTGIVINGAFQSLMVSGKASGNATQLNLGTVGAPSIIDVTTFNTASPAGQTSYTGTPGDVFLRIATAGSGALSSLNQIQT